jgi:hypothetical protein
MVMREHAEGCCPKSLLTIRVWGLYFFSRLGLYSDSHLHAHMGSEIGNGAIWGFCSLVLSLPRLFMKYLSAPAWESMKMEGT